MLGEGEDPDLRRTDLPLARLEAVGTDEREIARRAGDDRHDCRPAPTAPADDPTRRGDDLAFGQVEPDRVMPRLLMPGLMPGDERRPLPAPVVVVGEHRIPVQQIRDPAMVPPPPPVVGKLNLERDLIARQRARGQDRDTTPIPEIQAQESEPLRVPLPA